MKNYVENYPRPQLIRDRWECLDGKWDFAFDDENLGETQSWFLAPKTGMQITVPFTYETKLSGIGDETIHNYVWYFKKLQVENGSQRAILHFEGSDYVTKLWVNGVFVGSHQGGYSRFSFDITPYLQNGEALLAVKVEDSLDLTQPRGKQRWKQENFACWYVQTTGIWKTVWLEYAPDTRIEHLKLTPNFQEQSVEILADIPWGAGCTFTAAASFEGFTVGSATACVHEKKAKLTLSIRNTDLDEWGAKAWTPDQPNLYDLELQLIRDGKAVDTVRSYFGLREISIQGNQVLLNGHRLYQRLILDQGYWRDSHLTPPSEAALVEDIDKLMVLGYNGVRKHMKVEDERFLLWADRKGFLVWSEFPATYAYNDQAVENFTEEWLQVVKQNYSHPSIITWTPFNESWGVPNIMRDKKQQDFTRGIYYLTKAIDPMRPVICNDGWEHTVSDIITLHDYEERGEVFTARYQGQKDALLSNEIQHNNDKYAFAEGYRYCGQPVLISEYGGIAFNNDDSGWGYGNKVSTEKAFLERFDSITTAVKGLDYCCGFCYTQVTDVQQEINGLMDIDRNYKVDPEEIRKINLK